MHNCLTPRLRQTLVSFGFFLLLLTSPQGSFAQNAKALPENITIAAPAAESSLPNNELDNQQLFRLERVPIQGGAELITIHARLDGLESSREPNWVPLVTILRDTLGDQKSENDRLRYVWPGASRFLALCPFCIRGLETSRTHRRSRHHPYLIWLPRIAKFGTIYSGWLSRIL